MEFQLYRKWMEICTSAQLMSITHNTIISSSSKNLQEKHNLFLRYNNSIHKVPKASTKEGVWCLFNNISTKSSICLIQKMAESCRTSSLNFERSFFSKLQSHCCPRNFRGKVFDLTTLNMVFSVVSQFMSLQ